MQIRSSFCKQGTKSALTLRSGEPDSLDSGEFSLECWNHVLVNGFLKIIQMCFIMYCAQQIISSPDYRV